MTLEWKRENPAYWDDPKEKIIGSTPEGTFDLPEHSRGEVVPGEWWRVEKDGEVVGYGWMDALWGDAEVLLAVDRDARGQGIGAFIVERLESEARGHGLNYLYNVVNPHHPDLVGVTRWLEGQGFVESSDGLLKRPVSSS